MINLSRCSKEGQDTKEWNDNESLPNVCESRGRIEPYTWKTPSTKSQQWEINHWWYIPVTWKSIANEQKEDNGDVPQASLEFSPFKLVFGHSVCGPLSMLKKDWLQDTRLQVASELTREKLQKVQGKMKKRYDQNTALSSFEIGYKVLVLLPLFSHPLKAQFFSLYEVPWKISDLDYVVNTPDWIKATQMCHINMLKPYYEREKWTLS